QSLGRAMVDRELAPVVSAPVAASPAPVDPVRAPTLRVEGVSVAGEGRAEVADVSFDVRPGEIVGIAGVSGNGQRALADALAGLAELASGRVGLDGVDVSRASVRERCTRGLGYIPEDRLGRGVAPGLTVEDNLMLRHYWQPEFRRGPLLSRRAIAKQLAALSARIEVRGARRGMPISLLSGGNIQRAMLARELGDETRALVVCSPTRGLDIAVTELAHGLLRARRDAGVAIVLISEDLEEVLALSDRVHVMFRGRLVGTMDRGEVDRTQIGLLMAGGPAEES
ncbi:MAG TPA: ATP-binding cassette domain-containing protein, partial [Conexibacter sp.]|nr:ATP-binding cassette domain-containing protein [Conexibacter sp.]